MVLLVALVVVIVVVLGCALAFIVYVARFVIRGHRRIEHHFDEVDQRREARRRRIIRAVGERLG